ncbi:MAG: efflux RND transporter periplasmic adaptor subunit [Proteobacteria bacterium]|nr:efflux RND transporter periplasmic adaptor subunit [Pseudomonadota bacterium]HQR02498.1 efflux RND transporter periplasmic adaptor subunit [Rhodocyclaceae bacterium]
MSFNRFFRPVVLVGAGIGIGLIANSLLQKTEPVPARVSTNPAKSTARPGDEWTAPSSGFSSDFIKTAEVKTASIPDTFRISGKFAFDAEHLHLVSSRVAGRLDRIAVFEGAKVAAGQPLAYLYSPDWISAQKELQLAHNTYRTLQSAKQTDLAEDAKATEDAARNRILVLGGDRDDIARIENSGVIETHLPLRAPIAGTVTKRNMDPGAFLNVGDNFMTVSDTSHIWFVGNIYEQDYARIKAGQILQLEVPALPGRKFEGRVNFIGTTIDPVTHTLPVRCTVENSDGSLRPEVFALASVSLGTRDAIVVPKSAVISIRQDQYVIVKLSEKLFRRQKVTTDTLASNDQLAVLSGLSAGDRIVVEGASLISEAISAQ